MAGLQLIGGTLRLPSSCVTNESVSASTKIDADKMQHVYKPGTNFDLAIAGTPANREEIVFVASQAGVIRGFHALLNDTGTSTSVAFDLNVNGSTVLSGDVTITHSDSDGVVSDGTISSPTLAIGDIVSIDMAVSSSTGAQGPFAWAEIEEETAP